MMYFVHIYFCQSKFICIQHVIQYIIVDLKLSLVYYRGCTRGTVTFFKYDFQQKQLIITRTMHFGNLKKTYMHTLISSLHVSLDKWSRHLAVASYSHRLCVLRVFRVEDPPELCIRRQPSNDSVDSSFNLIESLTDRYRSSCYNEKRVIKVCILTYSFCNEGELLNKNVQLIFLNVNNIHAAL